MEGFIKTTNNFHHHSRDAKRDAKNTRDRQRLAPFEGQKVAFRATFLRTGWRTSGTCGRTALFQKIRMDDGRPVCDHVWIQFDEVENPEVLTDANLGKELAFEGVPYRYFCESGRRVYAAKYGIGHVTLKAGAHHTVD